MSVSRTCTKSLALLVLSATPPLAFAQDVQPMAFPFALEGTYNEIETKYIFGFTDGSDIGAEGEKSIELETNGAFRKRHGRYSAPSSRKLNSRRCRRSSSPTNSAPMEWLTP